MANLEHMRAEYAWEKSRDGLEKGGEDYKKLCKGAPALIMNNGLMQTMAYYAGKNKSHHRALNRHLMGWLHEQYGERIKEDRFEHVMEQLYQSKPLFYREATGEVLALLRWLRQFASVSGGMK